MSNPLVADKKDSTTAFSGITILESGQAIKDGIESGNWASVAMGAVGAGMDAIGIAMDPFGSILAAGVGWLMEHVGPLKEALNSLTGDPDQIAACAETWKNVAKEVGDVSAELANQVKTDLQSWTGTAADAYRKQAEDMAKTLEGASKACEGASKGVKTGGEVVGAVRMLVRDIIAQVVGHMISWALQVLFTLGIGLTWVVPQVVNLVAKTAKQIAELCKNLIKAIKSLGKLLGEAGKLFADAAKSLKNLKSGPKGPKPNPGKIDTMHPSGAKGGDAPHGGDGTTPSGAKDHPSGGKDHPPANEHKGGDGPDSTGGKDGDGTTASGAGGKTGERGGPDGPGTRDGDNSIKKNNQPPEENSTPGECRPGSGDPIDMTTGRMMLPETDVVLAGALPLVLTRMHFSTYRAGFRFGRSWASTLDQRLEIEDGEIGFAAEDGTFLVYPATGDPVLPVSGPHWPLKRSPEGGYVIEQPDLERMLYFAPDGNGRLPLTAIFDNDGHRIHFCHDEAGVLAEIRHSGGTRIGVETFEGLVTALTLLGESDQDERTELVRYRYDRDLRLTDVTNSSGQSMRYGYDELGRVVRWTDRNGRSYEFVYDEHSRCVSGTGADGHLSYTFAYDREARVNTATDSLGNTTEFHLNADFQLVREVSPLGGVTLFEWDRFDRMVARTDELGRTTRWEYDEQGDLVAHTFPDGARRLFEYSEHRLVSTVEPDGAVWRREYDEDGRLAAIHGPLGATLRYVVGEDGAVREVVDELGNRTHIESDSFGRPVAITDPLGATRRTAYDALGRIAAETDELGGTYEYAWTVEGAGWRRTAPDGSVQRRVYDGEGNVREEVDELGGTTRVDYGAFDLPVTQIMPDGSRLRVEYDAELRMTAATNGEGRTWRFEYDGEGRKVREVDFDGRVLTYAYDAAGQLVARTNALGEVTAYAYDLRGNLVEKRTADDVSSYSYDAAGRLVRAVNSSADVSFAHDPLGRVVSETCNGTTVATGYDLAGNLLSRRTPAGVESRWDYDGRGRPTALAAGPRALRFRHDAAGREIWRGFGAAELTQEWDPRHRLRSQTVATGPDSVAQRRGYEFRADNAISAVEELVGGRREFALDRMGRVVGVRGPGDPEQYRYDRTGTVTLPRQRAGQFDAQGRLVHREGWTYRWNGEDRLVGVTTPAGQQWRYHYDALGRRVAKQRLEGETVVSETRFVWSGDLLVEQIESTPAGRTRSTTWEWHPGDETPVAQTDRAYDGAACVDERFHAIVADFLGAPAELVDEAGQIAWRRDETLWGAPRTVQSGPSTPLRFPGQYLDAETGLHYNRHRYYDPGSASYLSADPTGLDGGLDTHAYVPNPLTWSDPFGLKGGCKDPLKLKGNEKKGQTGTSKQGLRYGKMEGKNGEKSRVDHVDLHTDMVPGKSEHGIFGTPNGNPWTKEKVVKVTDNAWAKVKNGDKGITKEVQGDRTVYTVPMDKKVGFIDERIPERGPFDHSTGKADIVRDRQGNIVYQRDANGNYVRERFDLDHLKIVVDKNNNIVTSFPDRIREY
ncbi:RHS repeat-associated core domain-containing protein [Amycolatopsis benzoatilytica]|uniref:RHS repeat-associated core domain-containing protein n=1 Tax=Amycolatopsis benzoatilytica TaxID=346045 RepID=UPI0003AB0563|nr:RHS repeat-associated core domain-containing protein [Amycolatopsis benzoatilytica]